jgi:phosphatidylinositol alpha-1,6-mannosyltransferase
LNASTLHGGVRESQSRRDASSKTDSLWSSGDVKRKRLVLFTEHFPNQDGGIAQWAYGLAKNLASESISVEVFAPRKCFKRGAADPSPASLSVMGGRNWHDMRNLYMIHHATRVLLRRGRVPFLCACWDMALVPVLMSKLFGFPVFVGAHGLEVARVKRGLSRRLMSFTFGASAGVLAVSEYTAALVRRSAGERARICVTGAGVDPREFRPAPKPPHLVERYGLSGKKVVLTIARLTERKGHDDVLRAFPAVLAAVPDSVYLIAGAGGRRDELASLAADLEIAGRVIFCGFVKPEELADHYRLSDVYVMTSVERAKGDVEGFGITYLEAGACERPVVAADSGGVTDAVEHDVNGLVVSPGDTNALADAIVSVLGDEELAARLGREGRRRVVERYNWRSIAVRLKSVMGYGGDGRNPDGLESAGPVPTIGAA